MVDYKETRPIIQFFIENQQKYDISIFDDSQHHNVIFFYFKNPLTFVGEECTMYNVEGAVYNVRIENLELFNNKNLEETVGEFHDAYDIIKVFDLKEMNKIYQR